ncbi:MAG: BlaI/MecI/CopY family transcriptional regulator [Alistipes sp.]|nr:BlaI/MecI/CopY family transcriptional regulator [Alistipes sp.]MBR3912400.1 BlaI/MecI/CopY family transcriptional regulator [Alistipes sp.]MBR6672138.1 BlaI/MecI/CopY family transcriptional regulator [Alistipes sp.]MBR7097479.1 BlaI/MecI/CopY family transcriptional regulator [Alistipes sp.]
MRRKKGELTRGEEEVMHHIWNLKEATVNDIVENMADPKPKYTTVATFIKLLENKGFVDHYQMGKSYVFIPVVKRTEYAKVVVDSMISNYFEGSISKMLEYYTEREDISAEEIEAMANVVNNLKK